VKEGKPLPEGTVITMVIYKAQVAAEGKSVRDANGRLVKGDLANVAAMEQRAGRSADYPEEMRNGDWEYTWLGDLSSNSFDDSSKHGAQVGQHPLTRRRMQLEDGSTNEAARAGRLE
jgi:hypothetical protein